MYLLLVSLREVHRCHPGSLSMCARPAPSFSPWAAAFEISEFYRAAETPLCCRLSLVHRGAQQQVGAVCSSGEAEGQDKSGGALRNDG